MVGPPSLGTQPRVIGMRTKDQGPVDASSAAEPPSASDGAALAVRLGWMLGGTLTMIISGLGIASTTRWTFGPQDAVFWSGAVVTVLLRYWDIRRFRGQTASGDPATMGDFIRYAALLTGTALTGWLTVQAVRL
jgi:hypothetical protein